MSKTIYEAPTAEAWSFCTDHGLNLLATLSIVGNVSDFEAGDELDLIEDDWD